MGGGPSTPDLVSTVSNAGGMGSLGAAYSTPEQIGLDIAKIKALTTKPFNVNLFIGTKAAAFPDPKPMLDILSEIHQRLKIVPPVLPATEPDPFPLQLEAMLANKPAVFSFTFGIPAAAIIARLKAADVYLIGTATTPKEALLLENAGIDAVVLQGEEAGAHRGTFADSFENSMLPTFDLLRETLKVVSIPLIASGGLMDGRDIAKALKCGAAAAQLGTAFLPCPETGAPEAHKQSILSAKHDTTVVTRAFSGRPARGIRNVFIEGLNGKEDSILPYPIQNKLTRPMRMAAARQGEAGYMSLWAGRGLTRARQMPAAQLVSTLVDEIYAASS